MTHLLHSPRLPNIQSGSSGVWEGAKVQLGHRHANFGIIVNTRAVICCQGYMFLLQPQPAVPVLSAGNVKLTLKIKAYKMSRQT